MDDDEMVMFNEDHERSWRQYLTEFKTKVYPMFQEYGMSFAEALAAWDRNHMHHLMTRIEEKW
jgi:hypothetical protein